MRRRFNATFLQDEVGESCRVGVQIPAASPVRRAGLPALAERAATQQALGAAIARRRVEPGEEGPVDRNSEELALRLGQHASERVVTVALVDARILTPPADRACVDERNRQDRKSTRLNSSHVRISYAVFCLTQT